MLCEVKFCEVRVEFCVTGSRYGMVKHRRVPVRDSSAESGSAQFWWSEVMSCSVLVELSQVSCSLGGVVSSFATRRQSHVPRSTGLVCIGIV